MERSGGRPFHGPHGSVAARPGGDGMVGEDEGQRNGSSVDGQGEKRGWTDSVRVWVGPRGTDRLHCSSTGRTWDAGGLRGDILELKEKEGRVFPQGPACRPKARRGEGLADGACMGVVGWQVRHA